MKNINTAKIVQKNVTALVNFLNKYPDFVEVGYVGGFDTQVYYALTDAVLAGKVLCKEGWKRKRDPYTSKITYNWTQVFDGVLVQIDAAETQEDMSETPVPPKAFPLQLTEV